jgi:hypothetical protein
MAEVAIPQAVLDALNALVAAQAAAQAADLDATNKKQQSERAAQEATLAQTTAAEAKAMVSTKRAEVNRVLDAVFGPAA